MSSLLPSFWWEASYNPYLLFTVHNLSFYGPTLTVFSSLVIRSLNMLYWVCFIFYLSYVSLSLLILQFHKILFWDIFSSNNSSAMFSLSSSSGTPIIWLLKHLAWLILCSVFVYPTVFLSVVQFQYFLFIYIWTHWLFSQMHWV